MNKAEFLQLKKKDQVAHVKHMLATNDAWLFRGVVRIYERQTSNEQAYGQTQELNGVGFGAFDAEFLTGAAQRLKANYEPSERYTAAIRKAMMKYAGQLCRIARGEA